MIRHFFYTLSYYSLDEKLQTLDSKHVVIMAKFIVLEGCDRSGKSTQCNRLATTLIQNDEPSVVLRFPDRSTVTGQLLDQYLKGKVHLDPEVAHLMFSANRWECQPKIQTLLNNGVHVIADRYSDSGIAYSMATGCERSWCEGTETLLIKPYMTIILDVDPAVASSRGGYGDEIYENTDFQTKVWNNLKSLHKPEWIVVDGARDMDTVADDIYQHVSSIVDGLDA